MDTVTNIGLDRLVRDRQMKDVQRFAGACMLKPCSIATHGALTALIFIGLCDFTGDYLNGKEMELVLRHDILEVVTGDLLSPAKMLGEEGWDKVEGKISQELAPELYTYTGKSLRKLLGAYKYRLFKLADCLEGWHQCQEELALGNATERVKEAAVSYEEVLHNLIESTYIGAPYAKAYMDRFRACK